MELITGHHEAPLAPGFVLPLGHLERTIANPNREHGLDPLAVLLGVQIEHLGDGAPARYRKRFKALRVVQF